jgi:hypothetical protein
LGFQSQAATAGLGFKHGVRVAIRCKSLAERRPDVVAIARCSSDNDRRLGFGAHGLLAYECVCVFFLPLAKFHKFRQFPVFKFFWKILAKFSRTIFCSGKKKFQILTQFVV